MNKAGELPFGNQSCLTFNHFVQQGKITVSCTFSFRIMSLQSVICQGLELPGNASCGSVLKGPDPQMAGSHPGEDSPRLLGFPDYRLTGGSYGQTAGRWNAKPMHGFTNHIFAEHWP
ncbi:hypothetical protein D3C74_394340 [compost metagenome]